MHIAHTPLVSGWHRSYVVGSTVDRPAAVQQLENALCVQENVQEMCRQCARNVQDRAEFPIVCRKCTGNCALNCTFQSPVLVKMADEEVYAVKRALGIAEVIKILLNPPPNPITAPVQRPKAHQVFVFRSDDPSKSGMVIIKSLIIDYIISTIIKAP